MHVFLKFDLIRMKKITSWRWQWPWRWAKFALLFYKVRSLCWLLGGWASTAGFRETLVKFWENKFLDFYSACSRKNFSIWKESWWPEILFMENSLFSRFTSIATPLKNNNQLKLWCLNRSIEFLEKWPASTVDGDGGPDLKLVPWRQWALLGPLLRRPKLATCGQSLPVWPEQAHSGVM